MSSVASSEPAPPHRPDEVDALDDADAVADAAVALVGEWLDRADDLVERHERRTAENLEGVIEDPAGVEFAMRFVDRVIRPEDDAVAAGQLVSLVRGRSLPGFLGPIDRALLRAGAALAPHLPAVVMPLARRRMRQLVGHLVVDADEGAMARHLGARRAESFRLNVNLLGEAVLGDAEADKRMAAAVDMLAQPDVTYVSVKVSAVVAQLEPWAFADSVDRVVERLRPLFLTAASTSPPTFVNLDMEEYHDLELTMAAFRRLLDEPALHAVDAGIVLQAYLPDAPAALAELVEWATERRARVVDGRPGGEIKIRLVKGANLAMERVDAAMHGWAQAPYGSKHESDANYKRCLDWVLRPERTSAVRIGVASHNLFDVAWAHLLSEARGVADRVEFEMLEGMAPGLARVVRDDGDGMLLYTPVVAPGDFDVAISYLFRRLEENAADENFIRNLFDLTPGSAPFAAEEARFRGALAARHQVAAGPRRTQDRSAGVRPTPAVEPGTPTRPTPCVDHPDCAAMVAFVNEPDTDPALPANRAWVDELLTMDVAGPSAPIVTELGAVDEVVARVVEGGARWAERSAEDRRSVLHAVADELARRRGDLVAAMVSEANKTVGQADVEVSEAVDFARWYGDRAVELVSPVADFEAFGVIAVVPPWNFPVAIPAGGVLAALAAGNGVVFKPAPQTPRCAEIVAECCWSAGVPDEALAYLRVPDDEVGRHLITHPSIDAVILTGAYETAELFRSWRPDLRILAETSGKNALVITPNADLDEAVADLVTSAFGHSGQKCSAASLGILVGSVGSSERFRRQLVDAVTSMRIGPPDDVRTSMGPMIGPPEGKLERALTELDPGERWLVEPQRLDDDLWSPGVRIGVEAGSWFHRTECFGPVLGLIEVADLDEAIAVQNAVDYGLTGGIHTLDPDEVDHWLERVEVGNAYVNRVITGAIVRRQPFGGWKRSVIGPGGKAGGPNYVAQLGRWVPHERGDHEMWLGVAADSDRRWWDAHVGVDHDWAGLFCEANEFRYRALPAIGLFGADADPVASRRVRLAAAVAGVSVIEAEATDASAVASMVARVAAAGGARVRCVAPDATTAEVRAAVQAAGLHLADDPVTADGRIELLHHVREQSISRTLHRHGNLL